MATQDRDDAGQFTEKVSEQDILKAFDFEASADDPYLDVQAVTDALATHWDIQVSSETVRLRLKEMVEDDLVAAREFGQSLAYRALVGPRLDPEIAADLEATADDAWANATLLEEMDE